MEDKAAKNMTEAREDGSNLGEEFPDWVFR